MFVALAAGASHPAVAAWLGLGTAGVAAVVVGMAWNVNARQIRLAEQLARRQFLVTGEVAERARGTDGTGVGADGTGVGADGTGVGADIGASARETLDAGARETLEAAARGAAEEVARGAAREGGRGRVARGGIEPPARLRAQGAPRGRKVPPEVIEGPDEVVVGEQARYRVHASAPHQVVSWAVGGGPVSHAPDPAHPEDLLLVADRPGELTIIARVREGLTERRATKSVTAVADVTTVTPPFTLRLFLHGWGLVAVAVLIVGLAGALDALGNFTSSDFIALAVPLAALLGVIAVAQGHGEAGRPANGHGKRHTQI